MRAVTSSENGQIFQFGDFRLDTAAKTLFERDAPVALTPKVFDTLQYLVENAGRLLEKDELMQTLWQDRFVEESNLTFNIKMLRRALHDDAQRPRFIETVPRRGYRFIAEVSNGALPESEPASIPAGPASRTSIYPAIAIGLILIAALLAFGVWRWRHRASAEALAVPILSAPFKSEKLLSAGIAHALITPDGKYVAYTTASGGKQSIWLRQLETSENIQIVPPSDVQYLGLAISHDGNSLYFSRIEGGTSSTLYRVMTFGGIPVKIADRAEGWMAVSPDDKQISFVRCLHQPEDFCSLLVTGNDGGNERRILTRAKSTRISANIFSRDGKSIVFASGQSFNGSKDFRLSRVELANGRETQLSSTPFFVVNHMEALPGEDAFLFTAEETLDGKSRIWQVRANGETRALTNDSTDYDEISLTKTGSRMVATNISNSLQLHLAGLADAGNAKALIAARTVTFTPDDRLVYSADDGDLWSINLDGTNQRQLTSNTFTDFSPRVSPDGRFVFFASNRSGSNQIWRMNADGSDPIQITHGEGGYPELVTADKHVYFQSGLNQTVWQVSTDGGRETPLWDQGVFAPAFSPDGKQVAFYFRNQDDKSLKIAVASLPERRIVNTFSLKGEYAYIVKMVWGQEGRSVIYLAANNAGKFLWEQPLDGKAATLIANLGPDEIESLALSPDGQTLAFTRGKWIHAAILIDGLK